MDSMCEDCLYWESGFGLCDIISKPDRLGCLSPSCFLILDLISSSRIFHPVSPIKWGETQLFHPGGYWSPHPQRDKSNFRKKETYPSLQSQSQEWTKSDVCLAETLSSTEMKEQHEEIWRNSWGEGRREPLCRLQGSQHFCSKSYGLLGTGKQSPIKREVRVMEPGNPLNGTDVGEAWDPRGNLEPAIPPRGGSRQHTWGRWLVPRMSCRETGPREPCKKQNFYGPPFPHLENNDPISNSLGC